MGTERPGSIATGSCHVRCAATPAPGRTLAGFRLDVGHQSLHLHGARRGARRCRGEEPPLRWLFHPRPRYAQLPAPDSVLAACIHAWIPAGRHRANPWATPQARVETAVATLVASVCLHRCASIDAMAQAYWIARRAEGCMSRASNAVSLIHRTSVASDAAASRPPTCRASM